MGTTFYPNIGEYSTPSTVWVRCVWQQVVDPDPGAFWEWHSAALEEQAENGHDWADEETFREITEETNAIAVSDVEACRDTRREAVRTSIDDDLDASMAANIQGTPGRCSSTGRVRPTTRGPTERVASSGATSRSTGTALSTSSTRDAEKQSADATRKAGAAGSRPTAS